MRTCHFYLDIDVALHLDLHLDIYLHLRLNLRLLLCLCTSPSPSPSLFSFRASSTSPSISITLSKSLTPSSSSTPSQCPSISLFIPMHFIPLPIYSRCILLFRSCISWLFVFALIDRYLRATKIPPPRFTSHFGAYLTTCITLIVLIAGQLPMAYHIEEIYAETVQTTKVPTVLQKYCDYENNYPSVHVSTMITCSLSLVSNILVLIMACVVGCTKYRHEFEAIGSDEDVTDRSFSRFFVVLSVVFTIFNLPHTLICVITRLFESLTLTVITNHIAYPVFAPICFAMVPALRRELIQSFGRCCSRKKTNEDELIMSSVE